MEAELKQKVDELFHSIGKYRKSSEFLELLNFCRKFHYLSPYNAMLVQIQRPGARLVLTAAKWKSSYNIGVKQTARPLMILIPFGPVDFVFDLDDTEGDSKGLIPDSVLQPFKTKGKVSSKIVECLLKNLKYYGIRLEFVEFGNQQQARIERLKVQSTNKTSIYHKKAFYEIALPEYYLISINKNCTKEEVFAALVHELAHFFCQHLLPVTDTWWKYRNRDKNEKEFEAETIAWLVCERIGIVNPSASYLSGYLNSNNQVPNISIECILKATLAIEGLLEPQRIEDGLLAKKDEEVKKLLREIKKNNVSLTSPPLLFDNI